MRPYKTPKIDLSNDYPCPCRRRGHLKQILLTEAFGCDRCQQIFVVKENGQVIEQLSSIYHKKSWRWTGYRWANARSRWTKSMIPTILLTAILIAVVIILLLNIMLQWQSPRSIIFCAIVLAILTVLLALVFLAAYRH